MSLFEPNFNTILKHLNSGDFGIAKRLNDEVMNDIIKSISDKQTKKLFIENSEFPYGTGNWALERTILQSLMEGQKASVLMSLNYLKIFGKLEYVARKFSSGPNPEVLPESYLATSRRLSKKLPNEYKGAFTEVDPGRMPEKILLGKFHQNGTFVEPTAAEKSGKLWNGRWPQYNSVEEYEQEQTALINEKLQNFSDVEFKEQLISKRIENLRSEYSELDGQAQLRKNPKGISTSVRRAYRPLNVTNQDDKVVLVNIEEDYDINVTEISVNNGQGGTTKYHIVDAVLNPDLKADTDILIKEDGTKKYEPDFLSGSPQSGVVTYTSKLLPILLEDGINTLVNLSEYIAAINKITSDVIGKRISNEFEFMDPEIAKRSDDDELKKKYYSEGVMIFDGQTKFKHALLDLVFKIDKTIPSYIEKGTLAENDDQMKYANTILTFMSVAMNTYTDMLSVYKGFLLDLMNPFSIVNVYTLFPQMNWLKQMVTKQKILTYLGSTDNTIYTTNLFEKVSKDWDKEITDKGKKFYEELLNKYIEQVSAVYNTNLTKISI